MAHILLTNDDGIEAAGLRALVGAFRGQSRITVFAPDHNWSAAGHNKTMHKPLRADPYAMEGIDAYTSTGAPADCVALALLGILPERPSLVVSGINKGANFGHDVTYSGTVAAAMEAVISGLPAVAVSLDSFESNDFDFAAGVAVKVVRYVQERGLPPGVFLNVNVPSLPADQVKGVTITHLGRRICIAMHLSSAATHGADHTIGSGASRRVVTRMRVRISGRLRMAMCQSPLFTWI